MERGEEDLVCWRAPPDWPRWEWIVCHISHQPRHKAGAGAKADHPDGQERGGAAAQGVERGATEGVSVGQWKQMVGKLRVEEVKGANCLNRYHLEPLCWKFSTHLCVLSALHRVVRGQCCVLAKQHLIEAEYIRVQGWNCIVRWLCSAVCKWVVNGTGCFRS